MVSKTFKKEESPSEDSKNFLENNNDAIDAIGGKEVTDYFYIVYSSRWDQVYSEDEGQHQARITVLFKDALNGFKSGIDRFRNLANIKMKVMAAGPRASGLTAEIVLSAMKNGYLSELKVIPFIDVNKFGDTVLAFWITKEELK